MLIYVLFFIILIVFLILILVLLSNKIMYFNTIQDIILEYMNKNRIYLKIQSTNTRQITIKDQPSTDNLKTQYEEIKKKNDDLNSKYNIIDMEKENESLQKQITKGKSQTEELSYELLMLEAQIDFLINGENLKSRIL